MEPLIAFSDEEVLTAAAPSNWVEVTAPRLADPAWQTTVTAVVTAATHGPIQGGPL